VIPPTLAETFSTAGTSAAGEVTWRSSSGAPHCFHLCQSAATLERPAVESVHQHRPDDFEPLRDSSTVRRGIGAAVSDHEPAGIARGPESDRLIGSAVHVLLQRHGVGAAVGADDVRRALDPWLGADQLVDEVEQSAVIERAAGAYATICARPDVREICAAGERLHEVPFTMRENGEVLRGTIDCVIRRRDGSVCVLEFKTGRPRPEHRLQLALYKRAAEHVFAGSRVEALLVYPQDAIAL
jgi:ATP-dependent exoDNAse (exonuclease V) beta subunit